MSEEERTRPVRLTPFPNGELGIVWGDGHESYYQGRDLRCACACAVCVDEATGQKRLREDLVAPDVRAVEVRPVGRYGISILWSDGHDTGIYPFERLRALCQCGSCGGRGE